MTLRTPFSGLLVIMLIACTSPQEPADTEKENVFSDQTQVLDDARELENTLLEAEKERRKQLEDDDG